MNDEFFIKKVIALLHDPPTKPWVINKKLTLHAKGHEEEAKAWLRELGISSTYINRYFEKVKKSDKLASSFDRWVLIEWKESKEVVPPKFVFNPFDPRKRYPVGTPKEKDVNNYLETLKKVVEGGKNWQERYHLLFASLEPLWYKIVGPVPPPADTRIPNHTVFDHLYATTTLSNIYDGKWKGSLVHIDFPSIQTFVKEARGARDAWAGSWLVSALAWKAVESFVWDYGPDVLLTPTARYNPFYYTFLMGKLKAPEDVKDVFNALEAKQPLMPATITALLPVYKDWQSEVLSNVKRAWSEIYEVLKIEMFDLLKNKAVQGGELVREYIEKVKDWPPLTPVVISIDVESAYGEYKKGKHENVVKVCMEKIGNDGLCEELAEKAFYHWLMTVKLREEQRKFAEEEVVGPRPFVPAIEFSEKIYDSEKRMKLCSCGLPAVVHNPNQEGLKVRQGESLCPYCLVKRLLSYNFEDVSGAFFNIELSYGGIGSTSTLAAWPMLINYISRKSGIYSTKDLEEFKKSFSFQEEIVDKLRRNEQLEEPWDKVFSKEDLDEYEKFGKYLAMIVADGDEMGRLISGDLGKGYLEEVREIVEEFVKSSEKLGDKLEEVIGKVFKGPVTPTTLVTPTYHAQLSYSLMVTSLIDSEIVGAFSGEVVYAGGDDLVALAPAKGAQMRENGELTAYGKKINEFVGKYKIRDFDDEFSKYPALAVWWLTRRAYWGELGGIEGFNELKVVDKSVAVAPALRRYGRKYGVAIRHYREPLGLVREVADKLEKESSNVIRVINKKEFKKDGVALEYGRGGLTEPVVAPNTLLSEETLELGMKELKALKLLDDALTSSAYRDVVEALKDLEGRTPEGVMLRIALYYALRNLRSNNKKKEVERFFEEIKKLEEENVLLEKYCERKKLNPTLIFFKQVLVWQRSAR